MKSNPRGNYSTSKCKIQGPRENMVVFKKFYRTATGGHVLLQKCHILLQEWVQQLSEGNNGVLKVEEGG